MNRNTSFFKLFEPGIVGPLRLKNRVIMEPMATNLATDTGAVTDRMIEYYEARARKGVAMVVVEVACVDNGYLAWRVADSVNAARLRREWHTASLSVVR